MKFSLYKNDGRVAGVATQPQKELGRAQLQESEKSCAEPSTV